MLKKGFCYLLFLILSVQIGFSMSVSEIMGQLRSHMRRIESIEAKIRIKNSGQGKTMIQKGLLKYSKSKGTEFSIEGDHPMKVKITPSGTVYINGAVQRNSENAGTMGDIYFISLLNGFRLRVKKEDARFVYLVGYNDALSAKKLITISYDKKLQVPVRINYLGSGTDYPYNMTIAYRDMNGLPVITTIKTLTSVFSISVSSVTTFSDVKLTVKEK